MIGVVGLNHDTAAVEVRERLVFDEAEVERFIHQLREREASEEAVIVSTCNRTEIYFRSPKPCGERDLGAVIRALCRFKRIESDLTSFFYRYLEKEAVTHLFRVAAGLDSMVLGENQILGQVKAAYRTSASRKLTGTVLNRLFHKAFEVGKGVRAETGINEGASSVGYAAVELASRIFSNLAASPVLLIGAGQTGELVLESLAARGNQHLHVANRTRKKAEELAARYYAEAVGLEGLLEEFVHSDIIIASTASSEPLVRLDFLREVMRRRRNRSLFIIDLSVPRGVEPGARDLEEVFVYDVDDLELVVAHNRERRRGEIEKAEAIVHRHTEDFFAWLRTLELGPTIARLKTCFETISENELAALRGRMPEESYERVRQFGEFIWGKYFGLVVKNLKILSKNGRNPEYVDLVNELFELRERESP